MSFEKVLVEEVMNDLSYYTQERLMEIAPRIGNIRAFCDEPIEQPEPPDGMSFPPDGTYYLRAPRGSILGRTYDSAASTDRHAPGSLTVYYPFFASHFCLPVKPGEHVWTFKDGETGYWVTRVCEPVNTEDPNFTHGDRSLPVVLSPVKSGELSLKGDPASNPEHYVPWFTLYEQEKLEKIPYINPQKIRSEIPENISLVKSNMKSFYNNTNT